MLLRKENDERDEAWDPPDEAWVPTMEEDHFFERRDEGRLATVYLS